MSKKTFYVITVGSDELRYSYAFPVNNSENLYAIIEGIAKHSNILTLNACDTKRQAVDTASDWNSIWCNNGILWLSAPMYYKVLP